MEEEYRLRDRRTQEIQEDGATTVVYEKRRISDSNLHIQNLPLNLELPSIDDIEIRIADTSHTDSNNDTKEHNGSLPSDEVESLSKFMSQSLKVVNRAIDTSFYDITVDYSKNTDYTSSGKQNGINGTNTPVVQLAQFYSQDGSKGRAITDIDWHSKYHELLASAHTEKKGDPHAPKGIVQIWNLQTTHNGNSSSSEYLFRSPSDILSTRFSLFSPTIIFGTCYNGQVLTWDFRAGHDPVLSSPLNGSGHSHPVYALELTGTQHAHNVLTASTDGAVCTWTPDILESPQDKLVLSGSTAAAANAAALATTTTSNSPLSGNGFSLTTPSTTIPTSSFRNEDIAPTRLAISPRDSSRFVVGTEEGVIYQCSRFGGAGSRAGIDPRGAYRGHCAPVTSLSFHSSRGTTDFSDLLLSGGLDWAIKLWRIRPFTGPINGSSANNPSSANHMHINSSPSASPNSHTSKFSSYIQGNSLEPLLDLPRDYEVYDVSWCNTYPSVFGAVDGSGHFEVWDLLRDAEAPIARVRPTIFAEHNATGSTVFGARGRRESSEKYVGGLEKAYDLADSNGNYPHIRRGSNAVDDVAESKISSLASASDYLSRPLNRVAWSKALSFNHNSIIASSNNDSNSDGNSTADSEPPSSSASTDDGRRVAVGGVDGVVTVFELDPEAFPHPKQHDWISMEKLLSRVDNL